MFVAEETQVRSVGGSAYRADRIFHDVYLSTGELIPEFGFPRKLRPGHQFELYGKTWQVSRALPAPPGEVPYAVEAKLLDDPTPRTADRT
jgi:hypothetical protein